MQWCRVFRWGRKRAKRFSVGQLLGTTRDGRCIARQPKSMMAASKAAIWGPRAQGQVLRHGSY